MESKCLLVCFLSFLLFPLATACNNVPLKPDHCPLNTEDLPLKPDHCPLNTEDLPLKPDHLPFKSDHCALNTKDLPLSTEDLPFKPDHLPSNREDLSLITEDLPLKPDHLSLNTEDLGPSDRVLPILNTITDFRNIEFGRRFPRHGLALLHCIVNNLHFRNNIIEPLFNPAMNDFGFHFYSNYENIFPSIYDQNREAYYIVGNINPSNPGSVSLPPYVTDASHQTYDPERNRDRIVVHINRFTQQVQAIYITQHILNSNEMDPNHTYRISNILLTEMRELVNAPFSYLNLLNEAGYIWPYFSHNCFISNRMRKQTAESPPSEAPPRALGPARQKQCADIRLLVRTAYKGYTCMKWENIPFNMLEVGTKLELYKKSRVLHSMPVGEYGYGNFDINQNLDPGLQIRLVAKDGSVIRKSPQLDDAYWRLPSPIPNYDASLQLYTSGGWASARLFIKKSFADWKTKFKYSWIGFYGSDKEYDKNYFTQEWAIYFSYRSFNSDYDVYEYQSNLVMSPGTQARFFLNNDYKSYATTAPWESVNF